MNTFPYYNLYVSQYATGISSAVAVVERILDEGEEAAADYREALRLGGRDPLDVLRTAGVDLTDPEHIERALAVYGDYLDEAASLL
jgi:oligoendopeptidase F